jgi:hypothetical protein
VAVRAGVAVAAGFGVATCACTPEKKATKPTRTHKLRKAIPDRIRVLVVGSRHTTGDRMAAHRKSDRRRVCLCWGELRKTVTEIINDENVRCSADIR